MKGTDNFAPLWDVAICVLITFGVYVKTGGSSTRESKKTDEFMILTSYKSLVFTDKKKPISLLIKWPGQIKW